MNSNKFDITISDILFDMVNSILLSKYKDLFVFKGAFALSSLLRQEHLEEFARSTTDIDVLFTRENRSVWREFYSECSDLLTRNSRLSLRYVNDPSKDHGKGHSWKHGYILFDVYRNDYSIPFQTKIDFKEDEPFIGLRINIPELVGQPFAVSYEKMIIDKVCNMQWESILLRYRDIFDVYCLSFVKDFEMKILIETWRNAKEKGKFMPAPKDTIYFLQDENIDIIKHNFTVFINKLEFDFGTEFKMFYNRLCEFVTGIYTTGMGCTKFTKWNLHKGFWV